MNISAYQKIDGVEAVLLADLDGNIIESSELPYKDNIALMAQNLFSKSDVFIKDFVNKDIEQIIFRFQSGFVLLSKLKSKKQIILLLSSDKSNLGILLNKTNN